MSIRANSHLSSVNVVYNRAGSNPHIVPGTVRRPGASPSAARPCRIAIDTMCENSNWITAEACREASLRMEPILNAPPFKSALNADPFTPKWLTKITLFLDKARFNFAIETLAYVLPDASSGGKFDFILGSDEIRKFDLLSFLSGEPKPFATLPEVPEAREVIENEGSEGDIEIDEDHQDMLNATSAHWSAVASIFQNKFIVKGDGVT